MIKLIIISFVGLAAVLSVVVTLALDASRAASAPDYRAEPLRFTSGSELILRPCGCKNDWPLATNERARSNAEFAQSQSYPDGRNLSALVPFWGQLTDHDLVLTRQSSVEGIFHVANTTFNMTRSEFELSPTGCRQLLNHHTALLDGSTVYGDSLSDPNFLAQQLKDGALCRLRTSAGQLLPLNPDKPNEFLAGDERASEHAFLTSLHTLLVREHNRLCTFVRAGEPTWTEPEVFWKVRQLVVAKIQKITYEEWLPTLFGPGQLWMLQDDLTLVEGGGAGVVAEFTVAAFRFGHTMVPDPIGPFALPSLFFNAQLVRDQGIEPFLQAALGTTMEAVDNHIVDGLRNFLFGMEDLVTRNLFRAREVGLPTYADTVECFGSAPIADGEQELFVGLLKEPVVNGSSLPLNLALILADQFRRLRHHDANFYLKLAPRMGARYELELLRGTLRNLLLDNTALTNVPMNPFLR